MDNPKHYMLEHYTSKNRTRINFPKNDDISVWQGSVTLYPKANLSKLIHVDNAHW